MSRHRPFGALAVVLAALGTHASPLVAQESSADEIEQLGDVTVTATRVEKSALKVPASVSTVGQDDIQLGRQLLGLDESLNGVPGLFFQDRYNFAQDLRIAIRGFGARSNFGIRGIRMYSDGIPMTTPDGQSNVDELDLGVTDRIEVIRGASSSLYGASSGGVINLYTEDGPDTPFVSAQGTYGSYDQQRYQLKGGGQYGPLNYLLGLSRLSLDGFRDQSEVESNNLNTKLRYDIDPSSALTLTVNVVHQPTSDDPGALTAAELAPGATQAACRAAGFENSDGRSAASCRNIAYNAGESVDQQKFGLSYNKRFGEKHEITLRNYYLWRTFENRLVAGGPGLLGNITNNSAWVEFDRFFYGGGGQYTYTDQLFGHNNRFSIGFDVDKQEDDRRRFDNNLGTRGNLRFDELEEVLSRGVYAQNEFAIAESVELTAGVRYDVVDYDISDDFLSDVTGDDSDSRSFDEVSPMVGLLWSPMQAINVYGNVSTAFETPSTTEFANTAANGSAGGLNADLEAQTSVSYEIGIKGLIERAGIRYDVALFHIDTEDELVNVTLQGAPIGRTFMENADETTRDGVEAALSWQPAFVPGLTLSGAYTYSDFEYESFTGSVGASAGVIFDGNVLPGIPKHQFQGQIAYFHSSGFYVAWDWLHVGDFYANNGNTVENESYTVANLRLGRDFAFGGWSVAPFLGFNNMFNAEYNGNVRVNQDLNGRFFEPAPPQNLYGGITVRYDF
jgi:iron complex outermembrane receptor protein